MIRVILAGAGAMGQAWLAAIAADPDVELAGVVDLDPAAAQRAAAGLPTGTDVATLAARTGADAVINVTVPEAHHPVTTAALFAGLPVLGEKPVADTLARALSLTAAAEATGRLFMVSQSRRWNPQLFRLRAMAGTLGPIGSISTDFFRAPRFGGFRERMAQPLLVDMAIHAFDAARFLLGADPVTVSCQTWNPPWSWYAGHAEAAAVFEMTGGARYIYHGSWCAPGADTSWNGSWRINAEHGTATWDGDHEPAGPPVPASGPVPSVTANGMPSVTASAVPPATPGATPPATAGAAPPATPGVPEGIGGALRVFTAALAGGEVPMGEVHENVLSLAMVEAAVESSAAGRPVLIDDVLARAHDRALRDETHPEVRRALQRWTNVRAALRST